MSGKVVLRKGLLEPCKDFDGYKGVDTDGLKTCGSGNRGRTDVASLGHDCEHCGFNVRRLRFGRIVMVNSRTTGSSRGSTLKRGFGDGRPLKTVRKCHRGKIREKSAAFNVQAPSQKSGDVDGRP